MLPEGLAAARAGEWLGEPRLRVLCTNDAIDGVLLGDDDSAFFEVVLPANRRSFIVLEQMENSPVDFDVFVTTSSQFASSCASATNCGFDVGSAGGEAFQVGPAATALTLRLHVNSFKGAGRFRLFVAAPLVDECDKRGFDSRIEVAYNNNIANGSADDTRGKNAWSQARANMLAATDGKYDMGRRIVVVDDVFLDSEHDLVYSDDNLSDCNPAVTWNKGTPWSHIEVSNAVWRGITWPECPINNNTPIEMLAEFLVHEWGHHQFELEDEREDGGGTETCRHSLMASGSSASYRFSFGWNYFEFCSTKDHGINPASGFAAATGDSNWTDFHQEYSELNGPTAGGVPISSDFSQLRPALGRMRMMTNEIGP